MVSRPEQLGASRSSMVQGVLHKGFRPDRGDHCKCLFVALPGTECFTCTLISCIQGHTQSAATQGKKGTLGLAAPWCRGAIPGLEPASLPGGGDKHGGCT